jgi:hypothetical protein
MLALTLLKLVIVVVVRDGKLLKSVHPFTIGQLHALKFVLLLDV